MRRIFTPALVLALAALPAPPAAAEEAAPPRRLSVIYFIGDGMGPGQVTLGRLGAQAKGERYHLDRFEVVGLAGTRSADWVVTDSAASATALAAGVKTDNQVIGLDPEGRPRETILEVAHREGYATGLVTTTRITHATPAGFVAKVPHRQQEARIARQMVSRPFPEVLIGGGLRHFKRAERAALRANGYELVTERSALAQARGPRLAALLHDSHLPYAIDGGPVLEELTRKAVEVLAPQGPYFLMVEGGRIDHACHAHDAAAALGDQLDFDRAIGWALDLAARDPDLLVVVTADHATGALGISELADIDALLRVKASSEHLTQERIDLSAAGGEEALARFGERARAAYGFALEEAELARVFTRPRDPYWAALALAHAASVRLGFTFFDLDLQQDHHKNTHGHDGVDVPVLAFGPGAERFAGVYENTEIPRRMAEVLGLPAPGAVLAAEAAAALDGAAPRAEQPAPARSGWF